jgi:YihY family inner membrane protein
MAKAPWTQRGRVLALRRRFAFVDVLLEMVDGFRRHRTGRSAALLAHYSFLSVFPLLLVLVTILGYVLHGNSSLQNDIKDSVLVNLPIVGSTIEANVGKLNGNVFALVLGLLSALWAGMKAFVGAQTSVDDIWDVPLDDRPNFLTVRVRALGTIALAGVSQVGGAALATLAGVAELRFIARVALVVGVVALNTLVLGASYRVLCSRRLKNVQVAPGALFAALGFAVLQLLGTIVVGRAIANASDVYGTFATVIGLFTWLSLHTTVALAGIELNRALDLRRSGSSGTNGADGSTQHAPVQATATRP